MRSFLVLGALACAGCMVGSISPPARVAVSGGVGGQLLAEPDPELGDATVSSGLIVRAEADLLSAFDRSLGRPLDIGLGFALVDLPDLERPLTALYGAMLSGRAHLWTGRLGEDTVGRLSLGANADALFRGGGFGGAGGTFTADLEIATWAPPFGSAGAGSGDSGIGFGALTGEGETGVGVRAEASYHVLEDATHRFMLVLGLTVRIPAHAGVMVFVPTGA